MTRGTDWRAAAAVSAERRRPVRELRHAIREIRNSPETKLVIELAGSGKTRSALNALVDTYLPLYCVREKLDSNLAYSFDDELVARVLIVAPTTRLLNEMSHRLTAAGVDPSLLRVIRGRLNGYKPEEGKLDAPCKRPEAIAALHRNGITAVERLLCKSGENKCPHFPCDYYQQKWGVGALWCELVASARLTTPRTPDEGDPLFAIVDEINIGQFVRKLSISIDEVEHVFEDCPFVIKILKRAWKEGKSLREVVDRLGAVGIHKKARNAIRRIENENRRKVQAANLSPSLTGKRLEYALRALPRVPVFKLDLLYLLRRMTLKRLKDRGHGIWFANRWNDDEQRHETRVFTARLLRPQLLDRIPRVTILDASPPLAATKQIFGPNVRVVQTTEQRRGIAIQVDDALLPKNWVTNTKSAVSRVEAFARMICRMVAGSVGLVTHKSLASQLRERSVRELELGHFGAIRGLDHMRDVRAMIVAGRQQPQPVEIEAMARGIHWDKDMKLPGDYEIDEQKRRFHKDPLVQEVLVANRESEVIQAFDRARWIHGDPERVGFILTKLDLPGVRVDSRQRLDDIVPSPALAEVIIKLDTCDFVPVGKDGNMKRLAARVKERGRLPQDPLKCFLDWALFGEGRWKGMVPVGLRVVTRVVQTKGGRQRVAGFSWASRRDSVIPDQPNLGAQQAAGEGVSGVKG